MSILFEDDNTVEPTPAAPAEREIDMKQTIVVTPYRVHMYWPGCPNADYADYLTVFLRSEDELDEFLSLFTVSCGFVKADKEAYDDLVEGPVEHLVPKIFVDEDSPIRQRHEETEALALDLFKQIFFKQQ